jgi:hypothetical protein
MKSGHHATAANLDNTLCKLYGALGLSLNINIARDMIATAVYNGPHVGSMRLTYAYLLMRNARQKISGALAYRLFPNPPMSAAYCNLELFMDSLNAALFFDVLDKKSEYLSFKQNMKEIRETMWYVAPYSIYMFGKTTPDPTYAKAQAATLAAYASAIGDALPNTSLTMSPALMKLANEANRNSISSALYVRAYSGAFVRYFRQSIETSLMKKFGGTAPRQLPY